MIEEKVNSNIFKDPYGKDTLDLTKIYTIHEQKERYTVEQENHYFTVGDALYYDPESKKFDLALADNIIRSEVAGFVYQVVDRSHFVLSNAGEIITSRYSYDIDSQLYLSDVVPGKIISIAPAAVVKPVATMTNRGFIINIARGVFKEYGKIQDTEAFTKEELDEIIKNLW